MIQTEHNGYTIRFDERDDKWHCQDLRIESKSLKSVKSQINAIDASTRRLDAVDLIIAECARIESAHSGYTEHYAPPVSRSFLRNVSAVVIALQAERDELRGRVDMHVRQMQNQNGRLANLAAEAEGLRGAIDWLYGEPEWWDTPREFRDMVARARALAQGEMP